MWAMSRKGTRKNGNKMIAATNRLDGSGCLTSLDVVMPMYATVTREEAAAICGAVAGGEDLDAVIPGRSRAWVAAAWEELDKARALAEEWLYLEDDEFSNAIRTVLPTLEDFSLAVVYEATQLRDNRDIQDLACEALRRIPLNRNGSVLLNYEWLYADMAQYDVMEDGQARLDLYRLAMQHNLMLGDGEALLSQLEGLMAELFRQGLMDEGVNKLACLVHAMPFRFSTWDSAMNSFMGMKKYAPALWMLTQAMKTTSEPDTLDELLVLRKSLRRKLTLMNDCSAEPWEYALWNLLEKVPDMQSTDMKEILQTHLLCELLPMPVKMLAA